MAVILSMPGYELFMPRGKCAEMDIHIGSEASNNVSNQYLPVNDFWKYVDFEKINLPSFLR